MSDNVDENNMRVTTVAAKASLVRASLKISQLFPVASARCTICQEYLFHM